MYDEYNPDIIRLFFRDNVMMSEDSWVYALKSDMVHDHSNMNMLAYDGEYCDELYDEDVTVNGHRYHIDCMNVFDDTDSLFEFLIEYEYGSELVDAWRDVPDSVKHDMMMRVKVNSGIRYIDGKYYLP